MIPTCLWFLYKNLYKHGKYINVSGDERDKRERSGPAKLTPSISRFVLLLCHGYIRSSYTMDILISLSLSFSLSLSHSLTHSLTHSLIHSLTHSLTHTLTQIIIRPRKLRSIYTGQRSRMQCSSHSLAPSFSCRCGKQYKYSEAPHRNSSGYTMTQQ